jgi:hypothetical protein
LNKVIAVLPFDYEVEREAASGWRLTSRLLLAGAPLTFFLTLACILWVDLPLARLIHAKGWDRFFWMRRFLDTPIVTAPAAAAYMGVYVVRRCRGRAGTNEKIWFIISAVLLVTLQLKNMLKIVFGRTWPREVTDPSVGAAPCACIAPSRGFLNDGIHAFHAFGGSSKPFSAFPSGSTATLIAVVLPLVLLYPRTRIPLTVFTALSLFSFVITNTHFVGDVVAGIYLGALCGSVGVALVREMKPRTP